MNKDDLLKREELIQLVSTLEDTTLIEDLLHLKNAKNSFSWDELSKAEQDSIQEGLNDVANKKTQPHAKVKDLYEKWL